MTTKLFVKKWRKGLEKAVFNRVVSVPQLRCRRRFPLGGVPASHPAREPRATMKFGKRLKELERPGWVYIDYKVCTPS